MLVAVAAVGMWGRVVTSRALKTAEQNLHESLVREARAIRLAREQGYRGRVVDLLQQAIELAPANLDVDTLRDEAVMCMGDFAGVEPYVFDDLPAAVGELALSPDGTELAIGLSDGSVLIRNVESGSHVATLRQHQAAVRSLQYLGDELRSSDADEMVVAWKSPLPGRWTSARTFSTDRPREIGKRQVRFTTSGDFFLVASKSAVTMWNVKDGKRVASFTCSDATLEQGVDLSPDQRSLAAGYDTPEGENGFLVWDVATQRIIHREKMTLGHVYALAFNPDSTLLVCACNEGYITFRTRTFEQRSFVRGRFYMQANFSPDGHFLAISDKLIRVSTDEVVAALGSMQTGA